MMGLWKLALLLYLTSTQVVSGNRFAECEAKFAAKAVGNEAGECFLAEAKRQQAWSEGARRLEALWHLYPENNWLPFYLGKTYW